MGCELDPYTDSTHTNKYKCEYTNAEIPMQIHKSRNTNANTQMDSVSVSQGHGIMVELCDVSLILQPYYR